MYKCYYCLFINTYCSTSLGLIHPMTWCFRKAITNTRINDLTKCGMHISESAPILMTDCEYWFNSSSAFNSALKISYEHAVTGSEGQPGMKVFHIRIITTVTKGTILSIDDQYHKIFLVILQDKLAVSQGRILTLVPLCKIKSQSWV